MLLTLTLPRINEHMTTAVIRTVHAVEGAALPLGAKLLDLSIDLSSTVLHDCPPISYYRIGMRDRAYLRRLLVAPGDAVEPGAALAQFSTVASEPLDAPAARALRISIAGILNQSDWWN